jgi:ParB-like chromosome segregation protein Spo0J
MSMQRQKEPVQALQINPEYQTLIPPLTDTEYNSLKSSIQMHGQQLPIIINSEGVILDGHTRYKIVQEEQITPKTETRHFNDKLQEKLFVIDSNLERRQLNRFQCIELELLREPILKELAQLNQKAGVLLKKGEGYGQHGIIEEIGKRAKAGHDTVRKVKTILDKAPVDLQDRVRTGQTINKAYGKVRKNELKAELIEKASTSNLAASKGRRTNPDAESTLASSTSQQGESNMEISFYVPPNSRSIQIIGTGTSSLPVPVP